MKTEVHYDLEKNNNGIELNGQNHENIIIDENDGTYTSPKKTLNQIILNYIKYIYSSALTMIYIILILWGIWTNKAVLPTVPIAHFCIFVFCLALVFYLEGLQVAILAVEHNDPEQKKTYTSTCL